jgi:hypothetical protein
MKCSSYLVPFCLLALFWKTSRSLKEWIVLSVTLIFISELCFVSEFWKSHLYLQGYVITSYRTYQTFLLVIRRNIIFDVEFSKNEKGFTSCYLFYPQVSWNISIEFLSYPPVVQLTFFIIQLKIFSFHLVQVGVSDCVCAFPHEFYPPIPIC